MDFCIWSNCLTTSIFVLAKQYYFYLAFENTDCQDYITEKFWSALLAGKLFIYVAHRKAGRQNWNFRSLSEVALFSHEAGRHFIWNFRIIAYFSMMRQVFLNVFVFIWELWIRWGRYQLQFQYLPTATSNRTGGATSSL